MPVDAEWRGLFEHGLVPSALGVIGRLMAMSSSTRKPKGFALLWEIPIAIGMGLIGISLARYFEVTNIVSYGIIIGVAYTGPLLIDQAIAVLAQRLKAPQKPLDPK